MSSNDTPGITQTYVAPQESPPSRRPPITESGIVHWVRKNLFASVSDSILTVITLSITGVILYNFLTWAFLTAQWEVAFMNLRVLGVGGLFPYSELWRANLAAFIVIFLALATVGMWGRLNRTTVIVVGITALMMVALPIITAPIPEPTVYNYIDERYPIRQVNFVAQQGQTVTFTIDPLTTVEDFANENIEGYVENNKGQANTSFDAFNTTIGQVTREASRDPQAYDLSLAVQVFDRNGAVIAQSDFTKGAQESITFEWVAPADGWYTYTATRDPETPGETGVAWLKVDNVEVFRSTIGAQEERASLYGEPPVLDCENCGTATNRTDMRFVGERTLAQWVSIQLTPYLIGMRDFFFAAVIVGALGFVVGAVAARISLLDDGMARPLTRGLLTFMGFAIVIYLGAGITASISPSPTIEVIRTTLLISFLLAGVIYAVVMFLRKGRGPAVQGLTTLWLISMPVVLIILTGFQSGSDAISTTLPPIETSQFGGLLLTLLLSAVAIALSFPLGILLALGRQSDMPVISLLCTIFIEVVRGVPLITLLFMGTFILPFFGFGLGEVDLVIRIGVVLWLFTSAYLAEVIRGGLQIIPKGQYEAAHALGLNSLWTTLLIVLPQGLRAVIPAIMGQAVSLFKDTSLVYIIGLFELTGVMYQILGDSQTGYLAFPREGYLYIGVVYFVFSYLMADVSRRIERTGSGAARRQTL